MFINRLPGTVSNHIQRDRKQNDGCQDLEIEGNGKLLFSRQKVSVLQN